MELRFNIIFTPGTVAALRVFVLSLLHHTGPECTFRLVTNGCDDAEVAILRRFCAISDRLAFYRFIENRRSPLKISQHGTVLNHLITLETLPHFCFMDSDIFALGDFVAEIRPFLNTHAALFSCPPVWTIPSDRIAPSEHHVFGGPHTTTDAGVLLGGSYFCVYAIKPLRALMAQTGVTFHKYVRPGAMKHPRLKSRIKARIVFLRSPLWSQRTALQRLGVRADLYDTGKLINLLLQARGHTLKEVQLRTLRHLGGISIEARQRCRFNDLGMTTQTAVIRRSDAHRPWVFRNDETCRYLSNLLEAMSMGTEFSDTLDIHEVGVRQKVLEMADQIRSLFAQFGDLLPD